MPAPKQTAANRMNSQKSTGPRTSGKSASSYDALKHGIFAATQIMFDEKAEDLAGLAAEYHQHHNPADPDQRFLVDTLIANEWRLRRLRRVEAELWDHATAAFLAQNTEAPACTSGDAFATASPTFERLQRIVNSCERVYHRALKQLQVARGHALRSQPSAPAQPPQPEQSTTTSADLGSFRQNPQTPPPTAPNPPAAKPVAHPKAPANPAETQPPAVDRDSTPPETD